MGKLAEIDKLIVQLGDQRPEVRANSKNELIRYGAEAVDALADVVNGPDLTTQLIAISCLTEISDPKTIPALKVGLQSRDSMVWSRAYKAIISKGTQIAEYFVADLDDANPNIRWTAARILGEIGDPHAIPTLISFLGNVSQNYQARVALAHIGEASLQPLLNELENPDHRVRRDSIEALGELKNPSAVPALISMLNDSDSYTRETIARALGRIRDTRAIPSLIDLLGDTGDYWVNHDAARALGNIGPSAIEPLLSAIDNANSLKRAWIGRALSLVTPPPVPHLTELLNAPDTEIREIAVKALVSILSGSINYLISVLPKASPIARKEAIVALGRIHHPRAIKPLLPYLHDPGPTIRAVTAQALGHIHYPHVVESLIPLLQDSDTDVQTSAAEALRSFASPDAQRAYKRWKRGKPIFDNPIDTTPES